MKHTLKRVLAMGTALVLTLGLSTAALAAEGEELPVSPAPAAEQTIAVQLDGQNLTFTDAVPQVKDQRTFLPFRAVFEAMGAEVSNEGDVITAARDGKTLTMTIGSAEATLTEGETATVITMDVAPYVDSATWRTYVPVRFAAQAFGCAVGWDQDDQTAVIVDTEKLLGSAKAGKEYTILAKYLEYSRQFNEEGVVADAVKAQMSMNMKLDLEELMADLSALAAAGTSEEPAAPTAEEQALLTALKEKGVGLEMRMDMDKGMLYMTFTGEALEALGLPAGTWYSMDMGALFEQLGMDYAELMDLSKTLDASVMLEAMLQSADLSDKDTAYATVAGLVDSAAKLLSDEGFQKNGSDYTTAYTYTQDGADMTLSFTLNTKNDKVVGYAMDIKMTMVTGAETGETTEVMTMTMGMDEKNHMTAEMTMDLLGLMSMNMTISGDYKTTDKTPAVEPPAGAVVVPFEELGMETAAPETAA